MGSSRSSEPAVAMPRYRSIADAAAAFDRDGHFTIGLDAVLRGLANSPDLDL